MAGDPFGLVKAAAPVAVRAAGAEFVAITPNVPERIRETIEARKLTFPVLRDEGNAYADAMRAAGTTVTHLHAGGQLHTSLHAVGALITPAAVREAAFEHVARLVGQGAREPIGAIDQPSSQPPRNRTPTRSNRVSNRPRLSMISRNVVIAGIVKITSIARMKAMANQERRNGKTRW